MPQASNGLPDVGAGTKKGDALQLLASAVQGLFPVCTIRVEANVADEETVTIGADVYEFDRADDSTSSNILITAHADDTPANATDALVAAINASGTEPVTAVDISDNEILLTYDRIGTYGNSVACAETMAGANNTIDATFRAGVDPATANITVASRVPTAAEVAHGNLHVQAAFVPKLVKVQCITTSTGALVAWDGAFTIDKDTGLVTLDNSGSTDWSVNETVNVLLVG